MEHGISTDEQQQALAQFVEAVQNPDFLSQAQTDCVQRRDYDQTVGKLFGLMNTFRNSHDADHDSLFISGIRNADASLLVEVAKQAHAPS